MPDERLIETSRPPTVVTFVVKVNGAEIPQQFKAETIVVNKEVNRIPWARAVFLDGSASEEKFTASNGDLFVPGNEVEIMAGYQSDNKTIFKGIIIKQSVKIRSSNALLTIDCKDKAVKTTIGPRNKYFTDEKDSDVFEAIIRPYGLDADIEATDVANKELVQYDSTDWDFIVNRADVNNKLVMVDDGKITIKKPDLGGSTVLSLTYGATILELDAEMDARLQFKSVKTKSWSSDDQEITEEEATDPAVSLNGNISSSTLAGVINLDAYSLQHGGAMPGEELQSWGKSFWWKHQAAKIRGRVRFKGIDTVKPGTMIEILGISDRFNGKCFVSGVQHHISAGDWQVDAQVGVDPNWFAKEQEVMCRPAASVLPGVCGLQVGKVTQLESDPDGKNRIKVFLPIIANDEQGFWARVSTLDAGNERGSFFLPEIGDEVIVGFINDDPRDAIVLGMVNSSSKPAPLTAEDANDQKGFVTRSKMKMIFDDDKKSFTLETPVGKKLTVDEDAAHIQMEDENGNKIIMDKDGITIKSYKDIILKADMNITMDAGTNIEAKAGASLTAQGSASADLKAGGTMTIKGAMVNIN